MHWTSARATVTATGAVLFLGLSALSGCTVNPSAPDAGPGSHTCADCVQAAACCQAVLESEGNTTTQCSSSETICQSLPLDQQYEYIQDCDSYLMSAPKDAAACQNP